MIAALLAAALALPTSAAEVLALPEMVVPRSTPGWSKQGKSLVLYDAEGSLAFALTVFAWRRIAAWFSPVNLQFGYRRTRPRTLRHSTRCRYSGQCLSRQPQG